jgi:hypothetical protein
MQQRRAELTEEVGLEREATVSEAANGADKRQAERSKSEIPD